MSVQETPAGKTVFGTGRGFGGSSFTFGSPETSDVSQQAKSDEHIARSFPVVIGDGPTSSADCHFYLVSSCSKGNRCQFRHSQGAKSSGTICRFWQQGFCKDDANCAFQHTAGGGRGPRTGTAGRFGGRGMAGGRGITSGGRGSLRSAWDAVDRSKQSCVFFAQGNCLKGDVCPFSHANRADDANADDASNVSGNNVQAEYTPAGSQNPCAKPDGGAGKAKTSVRDGGAASSTIISSQITSASAQNLDSMGKSVMTDPRRENNMRYDHAQATGKQGLGSSPPLAAGPDGKTYVMGPDGPVPLDAVVRTMSRGNDEGRRARPSSTKERPSHIAPGRNVGNPNRPHHSGRLEENVTKQGGVIALPDGGFVTRKRAAGLNLEGSAKADRVVRPRDARNVDQKRDSTMAAPGERKNAPANKKGSILDRLGPRATSTEKPKGSSATSTRTVRGTCTTFNKDVEDSPRIRPGSGASTSVSRGASNKHELPNSSPNNEQNDRNRRLDSNTQGRGKDQSLLSKVALSAGRDHPRRGRGERTGSGSGQISATTPSSRTSATLNFKIPTLEEIKSKKAKAEQHTASPGSDDIGETRKATTVDANIGKATEGDSDRGNDSLDGGNRHEGITSKTVEEFRSTVPQIDATDMDEFSEWM